MRVSLLGLIQITLAEQCNCSWASSPGACSNDDGSYCWRVCCKSTCDCSWTSTPGACSTSDGSYCWSNCCSNASTPSSSSSSTPTPTPAPTSGSPIALIKDYGNGTFSDSNSFTINGRMRFHSKYKYNLLGGGITATVDLSKVAPNVNANLQMVIPGTLDNGHFYCDNSQGLVNQHNACIELDIFESNGSQLAASTMHTFIGQGEGACNTYGCRQLQYFGTIDSSRPFEVILEISEDGNLTVQFSQDNKSVQLFQNAVGFDATARAAIVDGMRNHGAVIVSTMWTGWVPPNSTQTGDLNGSTQSLSNLVQTGSQLGLTDA